MILFSTMALAIGTLALLWMSGMRRPSDVKRLRGARLLALALVPVIAVAVYAIVGTPAALQAGAATAARDTHAGSLDQLAERLAAKLAANPDDEQGWKLLASTYDYLGRAEEARQAQARADALAGAHDADQAIETLRAQLRNDPNDAQGWVLLGRSYQTQRRFDEAADAFAHATELSPNQAAWWSDRADAEAAARDGRLAPVAKLIDKALQLNPREPKGLWLAATLALEQGDKTKALTYWRGLEKVLPEGDPQREIILRNIAELVPARGETAATAIRGTVILSPEVAAQVRASDTVFVFARATTGPRMPVAAWRASAGGFPLPFTLDQAAQVSPDRSLDNAGPLVVGAVLSRSGNAVPAPGDWEATLQPVRRDESGGLTLVIDQEVK